MKNQKIAYLKFIFLLILAGLFCSCSSENNQLKETQPDIPKKLNIFESVAFPLEKCSEPLPSNQNSQTITIYPVFINYSEENLNKIKSEYCQDSELEQENNRIKVASYLDQEKAREFQEFIAKSFNSAFIGDPITIEKVIDTFQGSTSLLLKCGDTDSINGISIYSECPQEDLDKDSRLDHGHTITFFENKTEQVRSLTFRGLMYASPKTKNYDQDYMLYGQRIKGTLDKKYHGHIYYDYSLGDYDKHERDQNYKPLNISEVGRYSTVTLAPGQKFGVRSILSGFTPNIETEFEFIVGEGKLIIEEVYQFSEKTVLSVICTNNNRYIREKIFGVNITQSCFSTVTDESSRTRIQYNNNAATKRVVVLPVENEGISWIYTNVLSSGYREFTVLDRTDGTFNHTVYMP
jgi:hypothetical protein